MNEDELRKQATEKDIEHNQKQSHNEYVRDLALNLFDQTQPFHELSKNCRHIMELAALHHHISVPSAKKKKKPERTLRKVLRKQLDQELSVGDLDVLAVIIATHQGKIKRKDYARLNISPVQQREALTMAALLRISSSLDDSRTQSTTIQDVNLETDQLLIIVVGPHAASDAAVAHQNSRLWSKIGYPKTRVLDSADAAEKLLLYPSVEEEIGVTSTDTLAEAGRKVMRFQFARMINNESGARQGDDLEKLHDMRVATRRMRAAFEVFEIAYAPGTLKRYQKRLQSTGRALGSVRDLDVFTDHVQQYLDAKPDDIQQEFQPFLEEIDDLRADDRTKMVGYLKSEDYQRFKRQFNVFLHTPGAGSPQFPSDESTPKLVLELAPVLIYSRLAAVRAFDPIISQAEIEDLHALRIEFRKFRYTLEFFREVMGPEAGGVIDECISIQDHLGALNDADVASKIIKDYLQEESSDKDSENQPGISEYLSAREAERRSLMDSFPASWKHFNRSKTRLNLAVALSIL